MVNGAIAYRAFDPSMGQLAELLGKHFTVYNYDRAAEATAGTFGYTPLAFTDVDGHSPDLPSIPLRGGFLPSQTLLAIVAQCAS